MRTPLRLLTSTPNPIPATFIRGGTSKGIFLNRANLPVDRSQWDPIFLGIMGSPDPAYKRQLNGMGGGISSLSKICAIAPSTSPGDGIDIEYTFAQVGIADGVVDYSGNCGNLSSMVGVFALDEGLCSPRRMTETYATVRAFNTNTGKLVDTTFPVRRVDGSKVVTPVLDREETMMAGVPGMASEIILDFISPSGARTGKLLPTGNPTDTITVHTIFPETPVLASLVDATNPTVFIPSTALPPDLSTSLSTPDTLFLLECIRQESARLMRLDPDAQAQPKIAILSPPSPSDAESGIDVRIHALSMGVLHRAVPMTVGLCLGVAARVQGTLAWQIVHGDAKGRGSGGTRAANDTVRIGHPSGMVDVAAEVLADGEIAHVRVARTGRRLMKGHVWW